MNYSDEPNVVKETGRSKKFYFIVGGGLLVFFGLLAWVVLFPKYMEHQRAHTPVGPWEGSVYEITLDGNRYSMELARPEELDFRLHVFLNPVSDEIDWQPEDFHVTAQLDGEEKERLEWDPETGAFGGSALRLHPMGEFRIDLAIKRGDETVWSGRRWSFQVGGGSRGHGHQH